MEKIVYINKRDVFEVNEMLGRGWTVKMITPYFENVSSGGHGWCNNGEYGAYVVLEKI